jgi:NADPH:quinone reductase
MKAWRIEAAGAPPRLVQTDRPGPAPGEVLIRVAACGLNFADLLMIKGTYQDMPPTPFTLGMEIAGVVEAQGEGVTTPVPSARASPSSRGMAGSRNTRRSRPGAACPCPMRCPSRTRPAS